MNHIQWKILLSSLLLLLHESNLVSCHKSGTKLTGFGSRSKRKKKSSIFNQRRQRSATNTSSTLWVRRDDHFDLTFYSFPHDTIIRYSDHSGLLEEVEENDEEDDEEDWVPIEGLYGVYNLGNNNGLVWLLISSSELMFETVAHGELRRVKSMELAYCGDKAPEQRQVQLWRQALKRHDFYYTTNSTLDITQTLQRGLLRVDNNSTNIHRKDWWEQNNGTDELKPDSRFFWNEPAIQPLLHGYKQQQSANDVHHFDSNAFNTKKNPYATLLSHVRIVTSAFVQKLASSATSAEEYDEILISRRNRFRAGTRFTQRGANHAGQVANAVETEQILQQRKKDKIYFCSHVQTRGSIPLRWSSPTDVKTYRPRVRIGTDPVAQAKALQRHLVEEYRQYVSGNQTNSTKNFPNLVFVNLIDKHSDQGRLGRTFDEVLTALLEVYSNCNVTITPTDGNYSLNDISSRTIKHIWYDFHREVKKNGYPSFLQTLVKKLTPTLNQMGYFQASYNKKKSIWSISKIQNGVMRTNCMDCLDRTNVVQSAIGRYMLSCQLQQGKKGKKEILKLNETNHRLVWANNADAISRLYAGTPALKGDFTRTGQRTKRGAVNDGWNSLQRFYQNNFLDADVQEGYDLLTGVANFESATKDAKIRTRKDYDYNDDDSNNVLISDWGISSDVSPTPAKNSMSSLFELRWLPGDLQSHLREAASKQKRKRKQQFQGLDSRSASDLPWWTATERAEDYNNVLGHSNLMNLGHLVGSIIATIQAPVTTALAVICLLGFSTSPMNQQSINGGISEEYESDMED